MTTRNLRLTLASLVLVGALACSSDSTSPSDTNNGGNNGGTVTGSVASVVVDPASYSIVMGTKYMFTAKALNAAGQQLTGKTATWSLSDASFGAVASTGEFAPTKEGTVNVRATIDGITGTAAVTVTPDSEPTD